MLNYLLTILLVFLCLSSSLQAQQLHKMIVWQTYEGEGPAIKYDEEEFDRAGRLIHKSQPSLYCDQRYEYDEKGRILSEENYCGEGYELLQYSYSNDGVCIYSESSVMETTTCKFYNQDSLLVRVEWKKQADNFDSLQRDSTTTFYHYDTNHKLVAVLDSSESEGKIITWERYGYNPKGQLAWQLKKLDYDNGRIDSTSYVFDHLNRATEIAKYEGIQPDKTFSKRSAINIKYCDQQSPEGQQRKFNLQFIKQYKPYYFYQYADAPQWEVAEIRFEAVHTRSDMAEFNGSASYQYAYDSLGRLTSIKGIEDDRYYDHTKSKNVSIQYKDGQLWQVVQTGNKGMLEAIAVYKDDRLIRQRFYSKEHQLEPFEILDYQYFFYE